MISVSCFSGFQISFLKFLFFHAFVTLLLISSLKAECNEDNITVYEKMQQGTSWNPDVMSEKEKEHCETHLNITIMNFYYSSNCTSRKCIVVSFKTDGFEHCYSQYYIWLVRLNDGIKLCLLVSTKNGHASAVLPNLEIGQYELLVEPKSTSYLRKQFFFGPVNVTNDTEDTTYSFPVKKSSFLSTEIIMLLSVGILLIAIGIFIVYKRSGFVRRTNTVVPVSLEVDSLNYFMKKAIKVYILHSHDDETTQKVKILKDFLSLFFESILIEDELPNILVSRRKWLSDLLEYQQSDSKEEYTSDKRIIIVESEKVSKNRNSRADQDIIEDSIFYESIISLDADRIRTLLDYHNIFVVQFDDSLPQASRLEYIVPGERYKIPEHVIDLCLNMSRYKDPESQQLLKNWFLAHFNSHPIKDLSNVVHAGMNT